jgi:pilus assembly protein TadC
LARLKIVGPPSRFVLNHVFPGWEDSTTATLLVERESFAFVVTSTCLLAMLLILRLVLRW